MMENWKNNRIQYPRLLEELQAAGAYTPEVIKSLCESMDLQPEELYELMERARLEWDRIKLLGKAATFTILVQGDEADVVGVLAVTGPADAETFREHWDECIGEAIKNDPKEWDIDDVLELLRDRGGWEIEFDDYVFVVL